MCGIPGAPGGHVDVVMPGHASGGNERRTVADHDLDAAFRDLDEDSEQDGVVKKQPKAAFGFTTPVTRRRQRQRQPSQYDGVSLDENSVDDDDHRVLGRQCAPSDSKETHHQVSDSDTVSKGCSCGALPDFSWQGMSAADDGAVVFDFRVELGSGAKERARTDRDPQEEEAMGNEVAVAQAPSDDADMLFDAFMFGDQLFSSFDVAVYEPAAMEMDSLLLLGGHPVFCNDHGVGLWSFDDQSVCYY
jgi:hypothetical protein